MIDTIANRRMTLNGKSYAKDDKVPMPKAQFDELGPDGIGWVRRAPAEKKAPAKSTESKSSDTAD